MCVNRGRTLSSTSMVPVSLIFSTNSEGDLLFLHRLTMNSAMLLSLIPTSSCSLSDTQLFRSPILTRIFWIWLFKKLSGHVYLLQNSMLKQEKQQHQPIHPILEILKATIHFWSCFFHRVLEKKTACNKKHR